MNNITTDKFFKLLSEAIPPTQVEKLREVFGRRDYLPAITGLMQCVFSQVPDNVLREQGVSREDVESWLQTQAAGEFN